MAPNLQNCLDEGVALDGGGAGTTQPRLSRSVSFCAQTEQRALGADLGVGV